MGETGVRIEIAKGPASEAEAAAVAAAIERFSADAAPAPMAAEDSGMDPWLKAALIEGVDAKVAFGPGSPPGMD